MSVIPQLKKDFIVHEYTFSPADAACNVPAALCLQYLWKGTAGVESLRLVLVPKFGTRREPVQLGILSMVSDFRAVRFNASQKGIFDLVLQAKLTDSKTGEFMDTDVIVKTITIGPIETPRYHVTTAEGWNHIELRLSDPLSSDLYRNFLWIRCGERCYRYPGTEGLRDCYIPAEGHVELFLYPAVDLKTPIRE